MLGSAPVYGRGVPDLLVGYGGANWLVEIKDGDKSLSKRQLALLKA